MRTVNRRAAFAVVARMLGISMVMGLAASVAHGQAYFYNVDIPQNTGTPQNTLTVVLAGDQTSRLGSSFFDPFLPPTSAVTNGAGNTTYTFDGTNTTITYSSTTNSIASGNMAHYGYIFQTGIVSPVNPMVVDTYWGTTPNSVDIEPSLSIDDPNPAPAGGNIDYLIEDIQDSFSQDGTNSSATWVEFPVPADTVDPVQIINDSNQSTPYFLSNAQYFFSPTQIPLDDLSSDPLFRSTTVQSPQVMIPGLFDGEMIPDGGSITVEEPEPASLALIAPVICLLRRRRR